MRLHTVDGLKKKMSADEHLVVAGKPAVSELYERLILPADHKKFMPKKADPLPQEQLEIIRLWIEQGAVIALAAEVGIEHEPATPPDKSKEQIPLPECGACSR